MVVDFVIPPPQYTELILSDDPSSAFATFIAPIVAKRLSLWSMLASTLEFFPTLITWKGATIGIPTDTDPNHSNRSREEPSPTSTSS